MPGAASDILPAAMPRPSSTLPVLLAALLGAALAFAAVVAFGASAVTRVDFPLDDAWIHLADALGVLRDGSPTSRNVTILLTSDSSV